MSVRAAPAEVVDQRRAGAVDSTARDVRKPQHQEHEEDRRMPPAGANLL